VSTSVALIGGGALLTMAIRAAGPVALGGRELPLWFLSMIVLLAPALLAALVATQALAEGDRLTLGPETVGVAAAGLVVWRTGSLVACAIVAAALTALLRLL
jgi:branched-subunit amino acid transport protein